MTRRVLVAGAVAVMAFGVAACGGDDGTTTTTEPGPAPEGEGDITLEIVSPADGDELELPFTLELDVSTEIGPTETGLNHVHLFVDGNEGDFEIIDSTTWEVTADSGALAGVEAGERELTAAVHTAEHEPVGVLDQVTVTLGEGGNGSSGPGSDY